MNYYSLPKLIWFRKDDSTLTVPQFEEQLTNFLQSNFNIISLNKEYSSPTYNAPDKDNQFMEGYLRDVYFHIEFSNHFKTAIQFYVEESSDEKFEKSWPYSFMSFSFYFTQGCNYFWIKECHEKLTTLLQSNFRDATYSYTFDGGLYEAMRQIGDSEAMIDIAQKTEQEILDSYAQLKSYIEIQHKPFLNIDKLLNACPNKEEIISIQLNNLGLKNLPESLFSFPNLQNLYLYQNPINKLDIRLKTLSTLIEINAHNTGLKEDYIREFVPTNCRIYC